MPREGNQAVFTPGYARYLVVSLTAVAGALDVLPWGWFEGS
jgi:hypothetical protein